MSERIEGRRATLAALRAGRVERIRIAQGARHAIIDELLEAAARRGIPVERVPKARLDAESPTGKHQGVVADAIPSRRKGWEAALFAARDAGREPFLVLVDGVQDPGNLGALIRSAAAFGADAVVIPQDRAAPVTETVAKAAAGALDAIEVDVVPSLQVVVERARAYGCWIVALAEESPDSLESCALLDAALALVVGAEARGVSRTLRNAADALVAIRTRPEFPTLNASVAGAIAMHEVVRKRRSVTS